MTMIINTERQDNQKKRLLSRKTQEIVDPDADSIVKGVNNGWSSLD